MTAISRRLRNILVLRSRSRHVPSDLENRFFRKIEIIDDATTLILARVFGNSPDFWLNVQRRSDLWEAMNSPRERERIERATPLGTVA